MSSLKWYEIQENVFTRWVNDRLAKRGLHVRSLKEGFRSGINLIQLIEILTDKSVKRYNKRPIIDIQRMENITQALHLVKLSGIQLVNVGTKDIIDGNMRIILGLVWRLILRFQMVFPAQEVAEEGKEKAETAAVPENNSLLEWIQSKIPDYNIHNFTKDWADGRAICALVNALAPDLCQNHAALDAANAEANAKQGIEAAFTHFGVEKLIHANEMTAKSGGDKLSNMTYLSQFLHVTYVKKVSEASGCTAFGPGLVEVVAGTVAEFIVTVPNGVLEGTLTIAVSSSADPTTAVPVAQALDDEKQYACSYTPDTEGTYNVSISVDGEEIPGSVFAVTVTEAPSLGGEGIVRVYYTTVTASRKVRSDIDRLEQLLTIKKVHLLPKFEPWIAVDMMERDDREAVFSLAGSRKLPLVFVDNKYIGSWDEVEELNEIGEFDFVFGLTSNTLLTPEQHLERMGLWAQAEDGQWSSVGKRTHYCGDCGNPKLKDNKYCPDCGGTNPIEITADTLNKVKWFTSTKAVMSRDIDMGGDGEGGSLVDRMRNKLAQRFAWDDEEDDGTGDYSTMDAKQKQKLLSRFTRKEDIKVDDLTMAAYYGDNDAVRAIIRSGYDVSVLDEEGNTAADIAFANGNFPTAMLLIKAGSKLTSLDKDIFFIGVATGQEQMVATMLLAGMNVNVEDETGNTPLFVAIEEHQLQVQELLIAQGAEPLTDENFFIAVSEGTMSVVEYMIAHGADPNLKDEQGTRILKIAIEEGFTEVAEYLRSFGALEEDPPVVPDLRAKECLGCENKFGKDDSFCLECGFPRDPSQEQERAVMMQRFMEQEAVRNKFFEAVAEGRLDEVKQIVEDGVNINTIDEEGNTVLLIATEEDNKEMVAFLTAQGAKMPETCTRCGKFSLGAMLEMEGNKFHRDCFVCHHAGGCPLNLVGKHFVAHEGAPYCAEHYEAAHAPHCGHCDEVISTGGYMEALGKSWHDDCFVCSICESPFPDMTFVNYKDSPYCNKCYIAATNMQCFKCKLPIGGKYHEAANHRWHMACFTCEKGNHELKLNETYHFYEEKVWCPSHFKELFVVRCTKCSEVISGDYSNVEKKPYHSACLTELTAELKAKADRVVSFDALRDGNYPAFVDADKKETYLSESDFESIFKQSRAQFSSLPAWKQKRAKLEHGLN